MKRVGMRVVLLLERLSARILPASIRAVLRPLVPRRRGAALDPWEKAFVQGRRVPAWPAETVISGAIPQPADSAGGIRCLLVTDSLETGGVDEVVALLARRLPAHGFEVAVLLASDRGTTKGVGPIGQALSAEGVEVVAVDRLDGERWVENWGPDVVYLHGDMQWPVEVANRLGVPAAVVLHGMHDLFDADGDEVLERSRGLRAVVAVSELVQREYLSKSTALDPRMTLVIPNGVDPLKVARTEPEVCRQSLGFADEIVFLSLARHCLQKNTYALVSAFEEVAQALPRAHLLVCGRVDEPVYTRQVIALRDRSRARDRIHLRDNAQRTDVLFGAADAFVLDSFFEGWALSSMEASASGVPVVLSDVGGAREQVAGDVPSGILVSNPLGDPIGLTWAEMMRARFRRQSNREELVEAMCSIGRSPGALGSRDQIAADAALRFDSARSVASHARLLRALVVGDDIHQTPSRVDHLS